MNKLTKEDVDCIRGVAVLAGDADIVEIVDAYLAQEEDLRDYKDMLDTTLDQADKLEAENQALKEENEVLRELGLAYPREESTHD